MSSTDFRIYQGVASRIYVTIKNSDRRVIPSAGKLFTAYIVSNETDELKLQRALDEIDASRGEWELTLLPGEVDEWRPGRYRMVVTVQDEYDNEYNLYGDLSYGAVAELKLEETAMAPFKAETVSNNWTEVSEVWYSSAFPGDAQEGRHDGLHTVAIYTTNFSGQFWVQVSLENTAPVLDNNWIDLNLGGVNDYISFDDESGIYALNFTVNAQWVRFKYDPDVGNTGTVDQVLYRI